jgi:hypothetical protein
MQNNRHRITSRGIFHTAGWLFADLLLALTIIFIAASVTGRPTVKVVPSPPPSMPITPTQVPRLELVPHRVSIDVLSNETIEDAVTAKIQSQTPETAFLQGRRVGLVVIFTGAPTTGDIPAAQDTDERVKHALQSLNINDFASASYYDSTDNNRVTDLTLVGYPSSFIVIDIYIFSQ